MKLWIYTIFLAAMLMIAGPAFALDLHQARSTGAVGEKLDGYVAVLQSTPDVEAMVAEVNEKRRLEYLRISRQNSQPVAIVSKLAAQQIIMGLEPGEYYQGADGIWMKR